VRASRGPGEGGGTLLERGAGADASTARGATLAVCTALGKSSFGIFGKSGVARGAAGTYSARRSFDAAGGASLALASRSSVCRLGAGGGPLLGLLMLSAGDPAGGSPRTGLAMVSTIYAQ
jgi:hypothetical protein